MSYLSKSTTFYLNFVTFVNCENNWKDNDKIICGQSLHVVELTRDIALCKKQSESPH